VFFQLSESPFGALSNYIFFLAVSFLVVLVDRAIGQVDKLILNVSEAELVRREANQAFLVDEDGEWLDACYEYIYA